MKAFSAKLNLWLKLKLKSIGYLLMKEPKPEKWVFIVGCYNSGTTLLHQLLAAHPDIGSMPNEGQFYSNQLPRGANFNLPRLWALKPELFYLDENSKSTIDPLKLRREWAWFYNFPARKILIEKTILNAARTTWLQKNFPNAYFISLYRNGYAVAEGIHRKEKHSIQEAATQWAVSNELLLNDTPKLKNHITVHYEELVRNPKEIMARITSFLNCSLLSEEVFDTNFSIHKVESSIVDMNKSSMDRLTDEETKIIAEIISTVMKRLNY